MVSVTDKIWFWLKAAYARITFNRVTIMFFLFSFTHCFAQGTLHAFMFSVDDNWAAILSDIVVEAGINSSTFVQFTGRKGSYSLELCSDTPVSGIEDLIGVNPCVPFYTSGQQNVIVPPGFSTLAAYHTERSSEPNWVDWISAQGIPVHDLLIEGHDAPGGNTTVTITDNRSKSLVLSSQCSHTLLYPHQKLDQWKRETLSLLASQFWLLGLSTFALVYESIPHLLALLCARLLATGWSCYAIWRTINIETRLEHLIGNPDTPCDLDIFPLYFKLRVPLQIAETALHWTALLLCISLSWRLYDLYSAQTFNCVGPPKAVVRINKYFLAVFVCLQLSVFFLVTAMGLWVDQLKNGPIAKLSLKKDIYSALFIFTTVSLIPWIMLGWFSVRREKKYLMVAFLGIAFVFISCWSIMFYSMVYRFTFIDWPFFGCMTILSFIFVILSAVFGVVCRLNFDKGLARYLYVEKTLMRSEIEPAVFPHDRAKDWKEEDASTNRLFLPVLLSDDLSPARSKSSMV